MGVDCKLSRVLKEEDVDIIELLATKDVEKLHNEYIGGYGYSKSYWWMFEYLRDKSVEVDEDVYLVPRSRVLDLYKLLNLVNDFIDVLDKNLDETSKEVKVLKFIQKLYPIDDETDICLFYIEGLFRDLKITCEDNEYFNSIDFFILYISH